MIISSKQVQNVLKVYSKQIKSGSVEPKKEITASDMRKDEVTISGESKIKQKAIQTAKEAPDIREERVKTLREAIATGTYTVADEEVAEKLIYRSLVDKLV